MNYIVISKLEGFSEGAELIKKEAIQQLKLCEIIYIENLIELPQIKTPSLFYFLTNEQSIPTLIKMLRERHEQISIINEHILSKSHSKILLQNTIQKDGVEIPKNMAFESIKKSHHPHFPIYLKSQRHANKVKKINDMRMFEQINIDPSKYKNFYLEEAVEQQSLALKKIYYVKGNIISLDESFLYGKLPLSFVKIMTKISTCLELSVFSSDIFIDWAKERYICIDVNPAPAFFNSSESRSMFVKNILI